MADPHLEQRRGPSFDLLARLAFFPSVISSFFTQNKKEGGTGPPGPQAPSLDLPLVSADQYYVTISLARVESSSKSHVFFFKVDH